MTGWDERFAALLFRLSIRAFPAELRAHYGEEMTDTFREAFRARRVGAGSRHLAGLRFVVRAVVDGTLAGLAERWQLRDRARVPAAAGPNNKESSMGTFWQDLRFSARTLFKNPGFAAVAVLTIGLGIGANAAIFSVVDTVLLRPLPFREPERLVSIWESRLDRGWNQASFTRANFWDIHDLNRSFDGIAAMEYGSVNLTGSGFPERLRLARVSAEFFQVLGVTPALGRGFAKGEDAPGAGQGVVLSHGLWSTRFGRDAGIVGRSITLDGQSYPVIGVLPRGEPWLDEGDVFLTMERRADPDRGSFELNVIGRMKPGVAFTAALADLQAIARQLAERFPKDDKGMGIVMESSTTWVAGDTIRRALWVLMGSVGFLLLIACVNLANLFLAKATGRSRERALRAALGASWSRLVRQTLTESLAVSGLGALGGLGLAFGALRVLKAWNPEGIPRLSDVGIDGWVLGFTAAVTVLTALLAGIVPALHAGQGDLAGALREGERNVGGGRFLGRLRAGLVMVEVAASLALLIGAGLLLRSFREVLAQDRGFVSEGRVLAEVALPESYTGERTTQFLAQLTARLKARPEVQVVAAVSRRPLTGVGTGMGFAAADKPSPDSKEVPWASWRIITRDYFRALGVPLVAGRDFTEQDLIAKPWRVIISKRLADRMWPRENAVGRTLLLWKGQSDNAAEVIGVAADMRDWSLSDDPSLAVYLPYYGAGFSPIQFVIQTRADPGAVAQSLRQALGEIDASLPLSRVQSMETLVGNSVASRRFIMSLLAAFAGAALVLALAGIYGVLSYAVSRRTSEIGVRLALGASPRGVLGLIVAQGMKPVLAGVAVGVIAAILLTRLMTSLLFGISATDVPTYAAVAGILGLAGLASCYLPARQALRVDVVAALRKE
ncbi:MAG TPA: ABC transporter permease [Gemmatimonadales bacterium]|jgi:putative ABC transport system permease protein|nr:ABC transporter permease [Gemmatimonadales bacterium]